MNACNVPNRTIFLHDNLEVLQGLNSGCIDLIYLDPPFNKNKVFSAPIGSSAEGAEFSDIFREEDVKEEWLKTISRKHTALYQYLNGIRGVGKPYNFAYLAYMAIRLIECYRVLKSTGSLYLHCDPTMSHYLKTTLDCIFGEQNFRNEVIWCYGGRGMSKRWFNRKHDTILFYVRSDRHAFFDIVGAGRPVAQEHVGRYNQVDEDGKRYARVLNRDGSYSNIYLKDSVVREDWWNIPFVRGNERTGYPTQKPLALLDRVVRASSERGG